MSSTPQMSYPANKQFLDIKASNLMLTIEDESILKDFEKTERVYEKW